MLLLGRRPVLTVTDPMVRFCQLVIEPYLAGLEAGRALHVGAAQTVIACREHKTGHEIDVLTVAYGACPRIPDTPIALIGEAEHSTRRSGLAEFRGLPYRRELLATTPGAGSCQELSGLNARWATPRLVEAFRELRETIGDD
jgi:hypothetical protein